LKKTIVAIGLAAFCLIGVTYSYASDTGEVYAKLYCDNLKRSSKYEDVDGAKFAPSTLLVCEKCEYICDGSLTCATLLSTDSSPTTATETEFITKSYYEGSVTESTRISRISGAFTYTSYTNGGIFSQIKGTCRPVTEEERLF